ncbi:MAG: PadR family transcriptional regulator [Woeseiaceae bacterium]|nr:PadR family transcriptional regulator [Woeseiaceae bacterium]NIP21462.1 PadR family transcriptional regulator [Woeseiaceae bacterium]NIS90450.1 PadR family transcriptional regulator [Woeseiaceae bacterium]
MDVKTVCLGMLTEGEASGYDLKKAFESSFGHCFAAGYGSIYPALASLAESGCVSCEEIAQDGKPDRKVYRITDKGWEILLEELDNPAPSHKVRSEFLAQMAFAHLMTPEQVQEVLNSRIEDADRNLRFIDEFESSGDCEWPVGVRFTLGFGRAMLHAMKAYVEENRHMFTSSDRQTRKAVAR